MSSIRWQQNDPYVYLLVNSRWYRYDATAQPVGTGAMGIVYLGFDCATNEKIAVKMLRQEFWNDIQVRNRLKLEASIILDHPNVIRMIGYCEDSSVGGPLYVLSEYVCGVTFKEHIKQLSYIEATDEARIRKTVSAFMPALDAVKCLHSYGVIHRDIKPDNLMFQEGYNLKLMDLGIAKADCFFDAHLKGFIGSKPYAAPEQVVPDDVEAIIDKRADIYALGVTLSYLLTGHFPIQNTDHLPQTLVYIINKATEWNPDFRYQSTDEMLADLNGFLSESHTKGKVSKGNAVFWIILASVVLVLMLVAATLLILNSYG